MSKIKKTSVTTIILSTIVSGILIYSVLLFLIIHNRLNKGLLKYFEGSITEYSKVVDEEILVYYDELESINSFVSEIVVRDHFQMGGFGENSIDIACERAVKNFLADTCVVTDKDGNQISSTSYGEIPQNAQLLSELRSGKSIANIR